MSTTNDLPSSCKALSPSFKARLRLPLPLDQTVKPPLQSCKSPLLQSVLPAPCASSDEVFRPSDLTQSQEFRPSPRFNFSSESSLQSDSDSDMKCGEQYWKGLLETKEKLLEEAKGNERRMENRLAECQQSTARAEGELRLCQQRNKTLIGELETMKSQVERCEKRLAEKEKEVEVLKSQLEAKEHTGRTGQKSTSPCRDQRTPESPLSSPDCKKRSSQITESLRLQQAIHQLTTDVAAKDEMIEKLQTKVKRLMRKTRNSVDSTTQPLGERAHSKENHTSPKHVLSDPLYKLLKVDRIDEAVKRIERLKAKARQRKHSEEFVAKLQDIIVACSPPEAFKIQPTLSDMWRWVRRLVEEYMTLRKQPDTLRHLSSLLHTKEEELISTVSTLVADYEELLIGLSRMKAKLRLPLSADVKAVAQALESRLS